MSKSIIPQKQEEPDNHDIFAFMNGLLVATFDFAKKCPSKSFELDLQNTVITPWARLMSYYKEVLEEKKAIEAGKIE